MALILSVVVARDNPFEAIKSSDTIGEATYKKDTRKNFINAKLKLPSTARILKSVEFKYQNLDGSIESKKVNIDKKIDWHNEFVIGKLGSKQNRQISKKVKSKYKIVTKVKTLNFKKIVNFKIDGNSIFVKTEDKKIRDFLVTNPHKIVVDFKSKDAFNTKIYNLNMKYFKKIIIGNHEGYYRVVIELDGKYLYNKKETNNKEYVFTLR